jgi:hypothetical protein
MKGWRAGIALIIAGLILGGGYLYVSKIREPSKTVDTTRTKVLSYLGALDCYSYLENVTTTAGNRTVKSSIAGGKINSIYYFQGRRQDIVWYAILRNSTLKELISVNGTRRDVNVTLSNNEKAMFLSMDPVRIGLQAVGAGKQLEKDKNSVKYGFSITVSPSTGIRMNGTVTVFLEGNKVTRLVFDVNVISSDGQVEKRTITAVIEGKCELPEWAKGLLEQ